MHQPGLFDHIACQRWRDGKDSFRPAGEPLTRQDRYQVVPIVEDSVAKAFVCQHHYAGTYPAAVFRAGLLRKNPFAKERLVGLAVYSVPCNPSVIPHYASVDPGVGCELGRFVLLDEEPGNAETFFLARAFRLLREAKPHFKAVISYADPVARTNLLDGRVIAPGHRGIIYQAFSGRYFGRGRPRTLLLDPSGRVLSERAISKLRTGDCGWEYAERQLVQSGAPARWPGESPQSWLQRTLDTPGFLRRVRHPGNHCYGWPLGGPLEKRGLVKAFATSYPYPKDLAA